ncbi:unnamed protein product [Closterium sp. NIES-64]|nr:unnamed protein product [Closterium sp. NIES-64]
MSRLKHPAVVPLLGYCIDYNEETLQMEQIIVSQFMPNGDLSQWTMPGAKPMSLRVRLAVLVDVVDGLSFLHNRRITHRDVKPANVLLDADMRAKVADFGFMRKMEANQVNTTRVMGTPGYVDPEYLQTRLATTATDVYSFGVLLLEMLTGREPMLSIDGSQSHIRDWPCIPGTGMHGHVCCLSSLHGQSALTAEATARGGGEAGGGEHIAVREWAGGAGNGGRELAAEG